MTGNVVLNTLFTQGISDSFGISIGELPNTFDGLYIAKPDAVQGFRGVRTVAVNTPTSNSSSVLYGTFTDLTAGNAGFNLTSGGPGGIVGHYTTLLYFGTGTATGVTGYYSLISSDGGAGTITNAYGVYIAASTLGVGATITNNNGIAVANQTAGTNNTHLLLGTLTAPSGNYSIYSASTYANYLGGTTTINKSAIATTTTLGLALENSTLSTGGATEQYSPAFDLIGHGWRTAASADRFIRFRMETRPVAGTPSGTLAFMSSVDTGTASWTDRMTLGVSGLLTTTGGVSTTTLTASSLTSGRVPVVSTAGLLTDFSTFTSDGLKLTLSTTGSTGGVLLGGAAMYGVNSSVMALIAQLTNSPPASTITSGTTYGIVTTVIASPAGASTARHFGLSFDATLTTNQNLTDATGGITGLQGAIHHNGTATITAASCGIFSGDTSTTGTITTLNQVYVLGMDISSGATLTTFNGLRVDGPRSSGTGGTCTAANWIALHPRTFSAGVITSATGIAVFASNNFHAFTANNQTRIGIDIGAMPDSASFPTGAVTIALRLSTSARHKRNGIQWGTDSAGANIWSDASNSLTTDGAFKIVGTLKVGTTSVVGQALTASDTAGNVAFTSIVNKHFVSVALCSAFTPAGTGADIGEFTVPYSPRDGTTSLTYNVRRIDFRVNVAGGAPAVTLEKYTGTGAFSATTIGTVTLGSGAYEGNKTSSFTTSTLTSGDKVRFNVGTLASATGWTIQLLLEAT